MHPTMRLSINLDADLHRIASERARARHSSISKEVNALVRQALRPSQATVTPHGLEPDAARHVVDPGSGLLISQGRRRLAVSRGRQPLTSDDVRRLDDLDDTRHLANLRRQP